MDLDRYDSLLLNFLQCNSAPTAERLADRVALTPSAIQRRVKRLKDEGYILAEVALVDPKKVGPPSFFVVSLEIERERPELSGSLRAWLAAHREIQQANHVTGAAVSC